MSSLAKRLDVGGNDSDEIRILDLSQGIPSESASRSIAVSDQLSPAEVLNLSLTTSLRHVCQSSNSHFESEIKSAQQMLIDPQSFFDCPLSVSLNPEQIGASDEKGKTLFRVDFSSMQQKAAMLESLQQFLSQQTRSSALQAELAIVADELFTNAVFNAPFVSETGLPIDRLQGETEVKMTDGKFGTISIGVHNDQMAMVCHDPYGSLNLNYLLHRIHDCYRHGVENMMNMGTGGAGIGSYVIFSSSTSYYAGVDKGRRTVIACLVPLNMGNRKRQEQPKNIHLIGF